MTPYELRWFEEPCDPLDYATLAEISDAYPHALSTGENLFSHARTSETWCASAT
jgi:L-alanine-DL-glutamate epimerase-like enolase superfamily enzyme